MATQSRAKWRTKGISTPRVSGDDLDGTLRERCVMVVGSVGPILVNKRTMSSEKRKTSMQRRRFICRARLSVVNFNGEADTIESGASFDRTRNSSAKRESQRSMRCQSLLEFNDIWRHEQQTCVQARRCLGLWWPYSQETQMSNICSNISAGRQEMGCSAFNLLRTEDNAAASRISSASSILRM